MADNFGFTRMSVRTPKTLLNNTKIVCGLTHSFIEWTNLTWSQMGDLSKIFFSQKLLINLVTYKLTNSGLERSN